YTDLQERFPVDAPGRSLRPRPYGRWPQALCIAAGAVNIGGSPRPRPTLSPSARPARRSPAQPPARQQPMATHQTPLTPLTPPAGDRYIVADGASGAWAGKDGMVAAFQDGGWRFLQPRDGWRAWVMDEGLLHVRVSGVWEVASGAAGPALQDIELLGLGTEGD